MSIDGRLHVTLRRDARPGRAERVAVTSQRPVHACRVFRGWTPDRVIAAVPRLFAVCGQAQASAAAEALAVAEGRSISASLGRARRLLVILETLREHLWRLLVDWPRWLGEEPALEAAVRARAITQRGESSLFPHGDAFSSTTSAVDAPAVDSLLEPSRDDLGALLESSVFGCDAEDWLSLTDRAALAAWAERGASPAARLLNRVLDAGWAELGEVPAAFLPPLADAALDRRLAATDADAFVECPTWDDGARETTPLSRRGAGYFDDHGDARRYDLFDRLVALLAEVAELSGALPQTHPSMDAPRGPSADALPPGVGIGQVEAARGRLIHRVRLRHGAVEDYRIVAPTEWNFHPRGSTARALGSLEGGDEDLARLASLVVLAVDPCVDYQVRLH